MQLYTHLHSLVPELLLIRGAHHGDKVKGEVGPCLQAKVLGNLGPQVPPSEQVPIVDVVRLVLTGLVGREVNCCLAE